MLKIKVPNLDGIEAHYHSLYTEQSDGTFLLTGIEGMKSQADIDKLTQALNAERGEHRKTKQQFAPLLATGMELTDIVALIDRKDELDALEAGGKNVDQLVQAKLKQVTAPLERDLAAARTALAEREAQVADFTTKERTRTIHGAIRDAALNTKGFRKEAIEDALLLGMNHFELTEDGQVVTKDGLGAEAWLSDLQQKRSHWWEASSGGGAGGSGGAAGGGSNPFTKAGWNMTAQAALVRDNPDKANQMAQLAGVKIGATAPVK
ncbi:hypothetical protein PQD76_gp05 [Stenotrophomonas phage BUCT626]|uniref:Uncharacterized protein n=1 Tax=Stenotrophomonas phage BUCT626 TaxID=2860376 RepID=A0AC61NE57_9CAUD|nr:hypothetical protein PQD76_gp05 [Stenotrophomonas phage BUCT626]QYC96709.1 hypothetical protein [Stenotrophomonas phage BUCT626]